uniref:Uncharacterized protein n=1 Tax=Tetranychus urticae TaxID=32264 RepID=T1KM27_TETUR
MKFNSNKRLAKGARRYSRFINKHCLWSDRLVNAGIKLIKRKKRARVT